MSTDNKKITEETPEGIKKWLRKKGYPLEMKVAKICKQQSFSITQSQYYQDKREFKYREIDVIANYSNFENTDSSFYDLTFVIECKSTQGQPWIFFTDNDRKGCAHSGIEDGHTIFINKDNFLLNNIDQINSLPREGFLNGPTQCAYGIVSTQEKDPAYASTISVVKAARTISPPISVISILRKSILRLICPIIVVSGSLYNSFLEENNEIAVTQIKWGRFLLKNPDSGANATIIDVVTQSYLSEYLKKSKEDVQLIINTASKKPDLISIPDIGFKKLLSEMSEVKRLPQKQI